MRKNIIHSLASIKNVAITVRGRFQIKKSVIDQLRSKFGGYFRGESSDRKMHMFSLAAESYSEIDEKSVMRELVEIRHCKLNYFHFEYREYAIERHDRQGKPRKLIFDNDVNRIISAIGGPVKKELNLVYQFPPQEMTISKFQGIKFGNLSLGGIRLMLSDNEEDSIILDWKGGRFINSSLSISRRIPITGKWPIPLLGCLNKSLRLIREAGVSI